LPPSTGSKSGAGADGMTMRQVMSHTAGVFNYSDNLTFLHDVLAAPTKVWAPQEILAYAASQPAYFPPGKGFHYSNTDYILAGLAVEEAGGVPLAQAIRSRILDKLDMKATFFASAEMPPGAPPLVEGHDDAGRDLTNFYDMSASWGAGAIAANGDDLTRFMVALQTGQLLDEQRLTEMRTVQAMPSYGYGIALMENDSPLGKSLGHDGEVIGYTSVAAWFPKNGDAVSVLCNNSTLQSPLGPIWQALLEVLAAAN
jgi:D-alanyl-D-alanine carboxypeptidase